MRRLSVIALAVGLCSCPPASGQNPLLDELLPGDAGGRSIFRPEGNGFRMVSPKPNPDRPITLWANVAPYALGGDFEFSVRYDVSALGVEGQPIAGEGNAELSLEGRDRNGLLGVNVGVRPDRKACFNVLRVNPNRGGTHYNVVTLPRRSNVGRLSMRREGNEVVFEIADGPEAPLVEVVRYPFDASVTPNPRLSIFQGNGRQPVPVNVLFGDVTLKADRIVRGPEARFVAAPPASRGYPVRVEYGKNPEKILGDFTRTNDRSKAFRPEGDVLRVRPPVAPQYDERDQAYYYRESRFSFAGDFECSCRFDVAQLGPVGTDGYGSCGVGMTLETESPTGSFGLARGFDRHGGQRFAVTRYSPTSAGGSWDIQAFPTRADTGRLIVRRAGAELTFLVQEGDGRPIELSRQSFVTVPIQRLRLSTEQGGNATNPVNVALSELVVKAARVDDPEKIRLPLPPAAGPVVLDSAPRPRSDLFLGILIGGGMMILSALVIAAARPRTAE